MSSEARKEAIAIVAIVIADGLRDAAPSEREWMDGMAERIVDRLLDTHYIGRRGPRTLRRSSGPRPSVMVKAGQLPNGRTKV